MNNSQESFSYSVISKKDLVIIKPLWEKLNQIHLQDSTHFKEFYRKFTFETRCSKFQELDDGCIHIEIITHKNTCIGYCVSSISGLVGEIESVFVEEEYRNRAAGRALIEHALYWFKTNKCDKIGVSVACGHESVFKFYEKFDFLPRMVYMEYRPLDTVRDQV